MMRITDWTPAISATDRALWRDFAGKPFAVRHKLAGDTLLTLPRIAELASELPDDRIEYRHAPDATAGGALDPAEVVQSIDIAGAWMQLRGIESSPDHRKLMEDALLSVAHARGFNSLLDAGFEQLEGCLLVSSPHSTMPFHLARQDSFLVQIQGEMLSTVFDNTDRGVVSEQEIERAIGTGGNLTYHECFGLRGHEFPLRAGDGCFVPYQSPHWIRTANCHSVALTISWRTRQVRRHNDLHSVNAVLRAIGIPQPPPGRQPLRDVLKLALYRSAIAAVRPLRAALAMGRGLRWIALGKRMTYYLKGA